MNMIYKAGEEKEFVAKLISLAKSRGVENEEMLRGGIVPLLAFDLPNVTCEPDFLSTCTILAFCNKDTSMEEIIKERKYFEGCGEGFYAVGFAPKERIAIKYLSLQSNSRFFGRAKYANTSLYKAGIKYDKIASAMFPGESGSADFSNVDFDSEETLKAVSKIKGRGKKEYLLDIDSVLQECRANEKSKTDFDGKDISPQDMDSFVSYICRNILFIETRGCHRGLPVAKTKEDIQENQERQERHLHINVSSDAGAFYSMLAKIAVPSPIDAISAYGRTTIQEFYERSRMLTTNKIVMRNGMGLGTWEHLLTAMIALNLYMFNVSDGCLAFLYLDIPYTKHLYHAGYRELCSQLLGRYPDERLPSFSHIIAARHDFYKLPEMSKEDIRMTESLFQIFIMSTFSSRIGQFFFSQYVKDVSFYPMDDTYSDLSICTELAMESCGIYLKEDTGEEVQYGLSSAHNPSLSNYFLKTGSAALFKIREKIKEYAVIESEHGGATENPLLTHAGVARAHNIYFSFPVRDLFNDYIVPVFCSDRVYFLLSPQKGYTKTIPLPNEFLKTRIERNTY